MRNFFSRNATCVAMAIVGTVFCSSANAQWGTLKGQIVLDGDLPKIPPLVVKGNPAAKDAAVCAAQDVPDEKLVVDPESKGIANVIVYMIKKPAKVFSGAEKSETPTVKFDQKGCRFVPHVMLVRTDQEVLVLSDDDVAHNTHTYPSKNRQDNFVVTPKDRTGVAIKPLTISEKLPAKINCDIHPWMVAYWIILDHPYAAVTDANGHYEIKNLPVGTHEFVIWQESAGYLVRKHEVTIKDGVNEQKPMKFTASQILK